MPALRWHSFFVFVDLIDNVELIIDKLGAIIDKLIPIIDKLGIIIDNMILFTKLEPILANPSFLSHSYPDLPIKQIAFPSLKKSLFYLLLNGHHLHLNE